MKYNSLMYQLINKPFKGLSENERAVIDGFAGMTIKKLHLLNKCIVIKDPTFDAADINNIKRFVTDETGLEACQNEINLNREAGMGSIAAEGALYFFEKFNRLLKAKYDGSFCSILSLDNCRCWVFRFHKIRADEKLWINGDLDTYDSPILYDII